VVGAAVKANVGDLDVSGAYVVGGVGACDGAANEGEAEGAANEGEAVGEAEHSRNVARRLRRNSAIHSERAILLDSERVVSR